MGDNKTLAQALQVLIREQLSSVEFVQDYVQLRFNGPTLNVYILAHQIALGDSVLKWGDLGYRDRLCDLIGHCVEKAEVGEKLSFTFDNGAIWSMSLKEEDYRGPEALEFVDDESKSWFVV